MIPFYGISRRFNEHREQYLKDTQKALESGQLYDSGVEEEFSQQVAHLLNRKEIVIVGSGSDALFFSALAMGLKPGDEVLCPAYSYIATASSLARLKLKFQFVDVNQFGQLDICDLQKKINPQTQLIVAANLFGFSPDWEKILELAGENRLPILEDSAQSFGAKYKNLPLGSFGTCSALSFSPVKSLPAFCNAGALVTDDSEIAERVRRLRFQGRDQQGHFVEAGYSSLVSSDKLLQLQTSLQHFPEWTARRSKIAFEYYNCLKSVADIQPLVPSELSHGSNWDKFVVRSKQRDRLYQYFLENGVECLVHYNYTLPDQKLFHGCAKSFPIAMQLSRECLSLPIYPELTNCEVERICNLLNDFDSSL